jgi:hypothetical protein
MRREPLEEGRDGLVEGHSNFYFSAKWEESESASQRVSKSAELAELAVLAELDGWVSHIRTE